MINRMLSHLTQFQQRVFLVCFSLGLTLITLYTCFLLARTIFFDKFIYQKSHAYGYFPADEQTDFSVFGERAEDLIALYPAQHSTRILGKRTEEDDSFVVVVIGDSLIWGQGLLNDERMVNKLENKLSKLRKTRVISLAQPGDSLFDNYVKYRDMQNNLEDVDLVVMALVENDLLFKEYQQIISYDSSEIEDLAKTCQGNMYPGSDIYGDYRTQVNSSFHYDSKKPLPFQKSV